jgi:hypothetical protein
VGGAEALHTRSSLPGYSCFKTKKRVDASFRAKESLDETKAQGKSTEEVLVAESEEVKVANC